MEGHQRNVPVTLFHRFPRNIPMTPGLAEVVISFDLFIALLAIVFNRAKHFDCLVGCFWFSGPLRQYFSLYRAVSQREGERGEKG